MEKLASGFGLIEGPVWHPERGLLFSDVIHGGLHRLAPDGTTEVVFAHRKGIGGAALHAEDGMVLSGRNIAFKGFDGERAGVFLTTDVAEEAIGFNDLTTDPEGRIYVGSLAFRPVGGAEEPKPAWLHMIDLDGSVHTLQDGVLLTNGLGVSPDGSRLFHSDSRNHTVFVHARNADGTLTPRQPFAHVETGVPDGLALAEDGSLWVAIAHGGCVIGYAPDGREIGRLACPQGMVTSVCFGGDDLRTLFVVTGSGGEASDRAGSIYAVAMDVPGLPLAPCRVPVPAAA